MKIEFTILGEVASMKNSRELVFFGKKPALIKSKKAREYERSAGLQIPAAARQMLTGPVRATMTIYYASQRPDLDEALLLDVLAAKYKRERGKLIRIAPGQYAYGKGERVLVSKGVYINDRQVRSKRIDWGLDPTNPRAEIVIEPMEPQQATLISDELLIEESADEEEEVPF